MFNLRDKVKLIQGEKEIEGQVRGKTFTSPPKFDVLTGEGLYQYIPAEQLRAV